MIAANSRCVPCLAGVRMTSVAFFPDLRSSIPLKVCHLPANLPPSSVFLALESQKPTYLPAVSPPPLRPRRPTYLPTFVRVTHLVIVAGDQLLTTPELKEVAA
eukprot:5897622-Prymnesium_polylepis.1